MQSLKGILTAKSSRKIGTGSTGDFVKLLIFIVFPLGAGVENDKNQRFAGFLDRTYDLTGENLYQPVI